MKLHLGLLFTALLVMSTALVKASAPDISAAGKTLSNLQNIDSKEIAVGMLAKEKGTTKALRAYGNRLVADHKSLDDKILSYAKDNNIELAVPKVADAGDLKNLTGQDFDRAFIKEMVQGHKDAIGMVEAASSDSKNGKFKIFLTSILPSFKMHEMTAEHIEKKKNYKDEAANELSGS